MSDTPETDSEAIEVGWNHMMVDADFARKLERERNAARKLASAFHEDQATLLQERNKTNSFTA
jgi:hypothetical protein